MEAIYMVKLIGYKYYQHNIGCYLGCNNYPGVLILGETIVSKQNGTVVKRMFDPRESEKNLE